jgi:MoaA/NifB/PqqE/SkfB family radical SAM enzyme
MRKISLFGKELQLQSHFCSPTGGVECGLKKYNLYIEAGGVCPARCSFCTGYRNKYHVDIDKLQYVISQLSEKNLINRISITGAEPFVYHDLDGIMLVLRKRDFANGTVYGLRLDDGYPIEVTDTFLPYYTKDSIGKKTNALTSENFGSRKERWMIGVSTMSGCPVKCAFCATGKLKRYRNLSAQEIVDQVLFVLGKNTDSFCEAKEHKINYTRMGEPFLNIEAVREAIEKIDSLFPGTHHYISTIGIKDRIFPGSKITLLYSYRCIR